MSAALPRPRHRGAGEHVRRTAEGARHRGLPPRGRGAGEHVRRAAAVAPHRGAREYVPPRCRGSRATAGPWGRRTFPPRCRSRAPPRGRGADEHVRLAATAEGAPPRGHVRRTAEVARHLGERQVRGRIAADRATGGRALDIRSSPREDAELVARAVQVGGDARDRGAVEPPNMSAALPRARHHGALPRARQRGRRTCPPCCRGRAPPRGQRGRRTCPLALEWGSMRATILSA